MFSLSLKPSRLAVAALTSLGLLTVVVPVRSALAVVAGAPIQPARR
ncbi:MAG: hypothetical protein ACI8PT_000248 [Gammaproteobacteria bacterium]|jgi:hypothetical protein